VAGKVAAWGAFGIGVPMAVMAAWLTLHGLWGPFLRSLQYLVYYGQLDGKHIVIQPADRPLILLDRTLRLGGYLSLVVSAGFGVTLAGFVDLSAVLKRRVALFAALIGFFALYPAGSGQFWNYHWLPMVFFACMCMGFLVARPLGWPPLALLAPRAALLLFAIQLVDLTSGLEAFRNPSLKVAAGNRPEKIAGFLGEHLEPGDVVQPYDWVAGGVVQGMLMAQARPATPYLYTFHFYHHVSTPYIRSIQEDFVDRLSAEPPAFVVLSKALFPFVHGNDTSTTFPAFDTWLAENYQPALHTEDLTIWERSDHLLARGGEAVTIPEDEESDDDESSPSFTPLGGVLGVISRARKDDDDAPREEAPDDGSDQEGLGGDEPGEPDEQP